MYIFFCNTPFIKIRLPCTSMCAYVFNIDIIRRLKNTKDRCLEQQEKGVARPPRSSLKRSPSANTSPSSEGLSQRSLSFTSTSSLDVAGCPPHRPLCWPTTWRTRWSASPNIYLWGASDGWRSQTQLLRVCPLATVCRTKTSPQDRPWSCRRLGKHGHANITNRYQYQGDLTLPNREGVSIEHTSVERSFFLTVSNAWFDTSFMKNNTATRW